MRFFSSSCLKARSVVWIVMNILIFSRVYLKNIRVMCRRMGWIARTIFGQEVSRYEDFEGTYFDGNGYFIDFSVLSDKTGNVCNLSSDDLLPGYANVEMIEPIGENHWEMFGSLQRFREVDGEEIIWKEARFHVIVHYQDGQLQLKSFEFTEQAMG